MSDGRAYTTPAEDEPMTGPEVRMLLLDWGDRAVAWIEGGGTIEMFRNDKRPDVFYLVLIGKKVGAQAVDLRAMQARTVT